MPVKCNICFFQCEHRETLITHIVRAHKNDPQFKVDCDKCGATFKKWASFRRHCSRIHVGCDSGTIPVQIEDLGQDVAQDPVSKNVSAETLISSMTPEQLRFHVAQYLLNIRESCKTSSAALTKLTECTIELLNVQSTCLLDLIKANVDPETRSVPFNLIRGIFADETGLQDPFETLRSKYLLDKYLVDTNNMVLPEEVVMGSRLLWRKRKDTQKFYLAAVIDKAYVIPILKNLKALLANEEVLSNVLSEVPGQDDVYRTVLDGAYYKDADVFKRNDNALAIIFYYDELGVANPIGPNASKHKMGVFYYTLGNINPRFRSTEQSIMLYTIANYTAIEKYGLDKLLEPLITDINKLQTEGIVVNVDGKPTVFKGSILFCVGDNPASAKLGGFKESVNAYRFCRTCLVTQDTWKTSYDADSLPMRNVDSHRQQISDITELNVPQRITDFWKQRHGVNKKSLFMDLADFDVFRTMLCTYLLKE